MKKNFLLVAMMVGAFIVFQPSTANAQTESGKADVFRKAAEKAWEYVEKAATGFAAYEIGERLFGGRSDNSDKSTKSEPATKPEKPEPRERPERPYRGGREPD